MPRKLRSCITWVLAIVLCLFLGIGEIVSYSSLTVFIFPQNGGLLLFRGGVLVVNNPTLDDFGAFVDNATEIRFPRPLPVRMVILFQKYEGFQLKVLTRAVDYLDPSGTKSFPIWPLLVPVFAWLAYKIVAATSYILKRRAAGRDACQLCLYDLRAHAPGDKCPECGTPVKPR